MATPRKTMVYITQEQRDDIYTMLFGPYRDSWRAKNGTIDNSDVAIAKRLNLPESTVSWNTDLICKAHFEWIKEIRNKNKYELPQHLKR